MSKHDIDAWTKALQRDISIGGAINIKRAEDYALGWNAASAYKDKRIEELEARAKNAIEQMVQTSDYLVSVARLLNPNEHLVECPAGIHAINLDAVGGILQEAISKGGRDYSYNLIGNPLSEEDMEFIKNGSIAKEDNSDT